MAKSRAGAAFYGFRFVNGPLLRSSRSLQGRANADRLPDLRDHLSDRACRARRGRPHGALRALQEHVVRDRRTARSRRAATALVRSRLRRAGFRRRTAAPRPPATDDLADAGRRFRRATRTPSRRKPVHGRRCAAAGPARPSEAEAARRSSIPACPTSRETIAATRVRQPYADRKDRRSLLRRLVSLPMLIVVLLRDPARRPELARRAWCGTSRRPHRSMRRSGCR